MEAKKAINHLWESKEFKKWHKSNNKSYLSYVFYVISKENEECQIGYYDKDNDLLTSFAIGQKEGSCKIELKKPEKPFKKEGNNIMEIELKKVKIEFSDAIAVVDNLQRNKYPLEKPVQVIAILQNLEGFGNIFNITYVTTSFKTLNVKVNAENGNILFEDLSPLISFSDVGKLKNKNK